MTHGQKTVYCQNGQITDDNEENPTRQKRSSVTNSRAPLELKIKTSDVSSQLIKLDLTTFLQLCAITSRQLLFSPNNVIIAQKAGWMRLRVTTESTTWNWSRPQNMIKQHFIQQQTAIWSAVKRIGRNLVQIWESNHRQMRPKLTIEWQGQWECNQSKTEKTKDKENPEMQKAASMASALVLIFSPALLIFPPAWAAYQQNLLSLSIQQRLSSISTVVVIGVINTAVLVFGLCHQYV